MSVHATRYIFLTIIDDYNILFTIIIKFDNKQTSDQTEKTIFSTLYTKQ